MEIAIVAIAKNENLYVNEWINWHLNLGFDKIIICDNNDEDSERLSQVIDNKNVIIKEYIGVKKVQSIAYTDMFLEYRNRYAWICFIDIDEYIFLDEKYNGNIKNFIKVRNEMQKNLSCIKLCWKIYTDDNHLDTNGDNRVVDRLVDYHKNENAEHFCKSIINTGIEWCGDKIYGHGYFADKENYICVNSLGERCENTWSTIKESTHENCYIRHYPTKTMGEFIRQKYFRGGPNANKSYKYNNLRYFWNFNGYSKEKEEYGKELIKSIINKAETVQI